MKLTRKTLRRLIKEAINASSRSQLRRKQEKLIKSIVFSSEPFKNLVAIFDSLYPGSVGFHSNVRHYAMEAAKDFQLLDLVPDIAPHRVIKIAYDAMIKEMYLLNAEYLEKHNTYF